MKNKLLVLTFAFLLVIALAVPALAGTPSVVLDGKNLTFDVQPTVENGRTLVPLRTIFEALQATVGWDEATQTVTATKGDTTIKLVIGGKAFKNDAEVALDVPAKVVDGRTLVPLRFVGEALGATVGWDEATETVKITSPAPKEETKPAETEQPATTDTEKPATTDTEQPATTDTEKPATTDTEKPATTDGTDAAAPEKTVATTFEEYLNSLPLDSSVIMGKKREAQFVITGEHAGVYTVDIDNGKITWKKGSATAPAITVTTTEKVWLDAAYRRIDPTQALMNGLFTAEGDVQFFVDIAPSFIVKKTE